MYGGPSGKLGRGGGPRGGPAPIKRNVHSTFQPSHIQRPSSTASAGNRNRSTTPVPPSSASSTSAVDESFSLVTSNPLKLAMILRLAPDFVDEIKRLEAQGGAARIKFDANPNNPSGNVIDVGGKNFRFTWSRETGHLCDIYEERRSGEDGKGLLVESGGAYRKLNMHRVLDESTQNHVKMRSEEAERKSKSRKAIVLEPGKTQIKALAASEANTWRMPFKHKKEPPFKKMRTEPALGGPPKSASKSGFSSTTPSKVRASASPLLSTPGNSAAPLSPFGNSSFTKANATIEDVMPRQVTIKENSNFFDKEIPGRVTIGDVQGKPGNKGKLEINPTDLRSLVISLLREKPQGMHLKALEKAIGDTMPTSVKQVEPILKKIAVLQAPGRYILKQDVELESSKKQLFESGSSPEGDHHRSPAPAPEPNFSLKDDNKELEESTQLGLIPNEGLNASEEVNIQHRSPDQFGEKKVSENSDGAAPSSSASGSDSDSESDSSDSGSDSGSPSRSKSRSPVGSGSGSSSDSESDASSNSKEGSDEDVDIMSDDDKEPTHKLQNPEPGLLPPLVPWEAPELGPRHNDVEDKDGHELVEIEKDFSEDKQESDRPIEPFSEIPEDRPAEEAEISVLDSPEHQEGELHSGNQCSDRDDVVRVGPKNVQYDNSERIISKKSKRGPDGQHFDGSPEYTKKLKSGDSTLPALSGVKNSAFSGNPQGFSPDRHVPGSFKDSSAASTQATSRTFKNVPDYGSKRGYSQEIPGKSINSSPKSYRRSLDLNGREKADKFEGLGLVSNSKHSDKSLHMHDGHSMQMNNANTDIQDVDIHTMEKRSSKSSKLSTFGDMHSDSHHRKHGASMGKLKEAGSISNSQIRSSPRENCRTDADKSLLTNGRGVLRREFSDLEVGELRETVHEEESNDQKRFERNSSFKQSENKISSDYWSTDVVRGKSVGKSNLDSAKTSPPHSSIGISSNPESLSNKRTPEHHVEDITRPHHKAMQLSRVDPAEAGSQQNKLAEISSKDKRNGAGVNQGVGREGNGEAQRKVPVSGPQLHEVKRGTSLSARENRRQKSNPLAASSGKRKDISLLESHNGGPKRRDFSSDENCSSYSKYEKEEPELKGPIKDISQYKDYIREYQEKYDSYCSLNKEIESYRNEFQNFGRELELAKGRDNDRYCKVLQQLMESYRQCGAKHKRLKKIFVVLHHELQHLKQMITNFASSYTKS